MITAVVAVRKGSQRVPNKNIKPFGNSNLLQMKLDVLKEVDGIDDIIVNSDGSKSPEELVDYIIKRLIDMGYLLKTQTL